MLDQSVLDLNHNFKVPVFCKSQAYYYSNVV